MDPALLSATHPTYQADVWARYDALYRGGEAIRPLLSALLPRNPQEPEEVYLARKAEAHYTGYVGPIVDWFAAKLCASSLLVRPRTAAATDAPDPFYAAWKEDVDGAGTDLIDFLRQRFTRACVTGRAWWLAQMPDADDGPAPATRAQWDAAGLGGATITAVENEQVLDFEEDERGAFLWAVVHTIETPRASWAVGRCRVVERWRCYDRADVTTYELAYDPATEQRPTAARLVGTRPHGFRRVPLVCLGFVGSRAVRVRVGARTVTVGGTKLEGFWLLARLADVQVAHFRSGAALDWSIKRTCYAMPVFYLQSEDEGKERQTQGVGYYIKLGAEERAEWLAPPTAHLDVLSSRIASLRDEIYRVANQMAQGVDNNAAAIGRSGESKAVDAASTEVVLRVYGALCREAVERTYELLAEGRGDAVGWSIEGLDTFSLVDAAAVVMAATDASTLDVPSPTFRRELLYRVADALLPGVDQPTKDAIREEIDAGVTAEVELRAAAAPPPPAGEDAHDIQEQLVPEAA